MTAKERGFRNRALARIHIARKELQMEDPTYRTMLHEIGGVDSSKDLDAVGLNRVLDHLSRCGFKGKASYPGRPKNFGDEDRGPMLRKIEALLTIGGKSWRYADGIAKRVCKIQRVAWCRPAELHTVIGILASNAKRYGWGETKTAAK